MSYRSAARSLLLLPRGIRFVARHPFVFSVGLVLAVSVGAALQYLEHREELAGERRFAVRAGMAATFVSSYVDSLGKDQRSAARAHLAAGRVPDADLARIVEGSRFTNALLLDSSGRVREAHPVKPGLVGTRIAPRYQHLQRALAGRTAVSNVVTSAVKRLPVVAIATPFQTSTGRGVFSTAYQLSSSPLTAFLASAMPMTDDDAYVIDANGAIVASKRREASVTNLSLHDAALSRAIAQGPSGVVAKGVHKRFFVVRRIENTPWRFVAARPLPTVHPSWHGDRQWVSTALAVAAGAAILLIGALLARLLETRTRLLRDVARRERVEADLVRERALLAHQATHDPLTGLPNRALLFARMEQVYAHGARDPQRLAGILFIDLDGFKPVNDAHGHEVGDRVLTTVAERLRNAVRPSDTVSRLGGDEFAVLCDPLAGECMRAIAERLRTAIERPIPIGGGRTVSVGASVGLAQRPAAVGNPHQLLADADAAMYASKVARRGRRQPTPAAASA